MPDTLSVTPISGRVAVITLIRGGNGGPVTATQAVKEDGGFDFKVKLGKYQLKVSAPALRNLHLDLQVRRSTAIKDQKKIIVMGAGFTKSRSGSSAELRVGKLHKLNHSGGR
jgi:hypothetical protein